LGGISYEIKNKIKEKYKRRVVLLIFVLCYANSIAQVQKKLVNTVADKAIADSLYERSSLNIKKGAFKEAHNNVKKALKIFFELNDNKAIGDCNNRIATIYYYQGKFPNSLSSFEQSVVFYEKANNNKGIASSYNNMGAVYYYLGNYPKALINYEKAVKLQETLDFKQQTITTIINIGGIYLEINDYANAISNFLKAKKINESLSNKRTMSHILTGIGFVNMKQKEYSKALSNFEQALHFAEEYNDKQKKIEILFNLGKLYRIQKEFKKALNYYKQTLSLAKEINSSIYKSKTLIAIGLVKEKTNNHYIAIKNCNKGLEIAEELEVISIQKEACKCLYQSYKSINHTKKALLYNEKMHTLKDSLHLKETSDKILNMKFKEEMLLDSIANVEKRRKVQEKHKLEVQKKEKQRNIFIIAGIFALLIAGFIFTRLNYVKKSKKILQIEKDRSEHLLLNILPEEIAEELKEKGAVDAQDYDTVSILFTDFKSFTETASKLSPQKLVEELNVCFKAFDYIMEKYNIEKIKTIGDAYMAVGGLASKDMRFVKKTILAGLDMQAFIHKRKIENTEIGIPAFSMRVGIHVGPIVAGIVGVKKFQYDVWGDTVNIASRMESNGSVEKVNISRDTYLIVKEESDFIFEYRGKIKAKGKGEMEMYFVSKV